MSYSLQSKVLTSLLTNLKPRQTLRQKILSVRRDRLFAPVRVTLYCNVFRRQDAENRHFNSIMRQTGRKHTPAYKRIQNAIVQQIENGHLHPGDEVGSERTLAKLHDVSLMTARHALTELAREGLVKRVHGAGTFVAPPRIQFNKLMSYTEQMSVRGLSVHSKILYFAMMDDPEVAARLSVRATRFLKLERLRFGGDEPFAIESCYLSTEQFPGLARKAFSHSSLFSTVEREYGVRISYADEEIDATAADARSSRLLSIDSGEPLLRIRQIIYSGEGKAIMYVLGLYRSERHALLIRRFR
jgi:GntR family transcriptional regulator